MAMPFRLHAAATGSIRAGAQRASISMRGGAGAGGGRDVASAAAVVAGPGRPVTRRLGGQQAIAVGIAGAVTLGATVVAVSAADIEGPDGTPRPLVPSLEEVCGFLRLGRIVHADAAPGGAAFEVPGEGGDGAGVAPLAEGEKPEFIKQADAEVSNVRRDTRIHESCCLLCMIM